MKVYYRKYKETFKSDLKFFFPGLSKVSHCFKSVTKIKYTTAIYCLLRVDYVGNEVSMFKYI